MNEQSSDTKKEEIKNPQTAIFYPRGYVEGQQLNIILKIRIDILQTTWKETNWEV